MTSLRNLPRTVILHIGSFIDLPSNLNLALVAKWLHHFICEMKDNRNSAILSKAAHLLKLVEKNQLNAAENMVKRDPGILLQAARTSDQSGRDFRAITAFQYAILVSNNDMWKMFIKYMPEDSVISQLQAYIRLYGSNINVDPAFTEFKQNLLLIAHLRDDVLPYPDVLLELLSHNPDVNMPYTSLCGNVHTLLSMAIQRGHVASVEILVEFGAHPLKTELIPDATGLRLLTQTQMNLDASFDRDQTLLSHYASLEQPECVEILASAGANVDWANANGKTALMIAAYHGQLGMLQTLLDCGANPFITCNGETAYLIAKGSRKKYAGVYLLARSVNPDLQDITLDDLKKYELICPYMSGSVHDHVEIKAFFESRIHTLLKQKHIKCSHRVTFSLHQLIDDNFYLVESEQGIALLMELVVYINSFDRMSSNIAEMLVVYSQYYNNENELIEFVKFLNHFFNINGKNDHSLQTFNRMFNRYYSPSQMQEVMDLFNSVYNENIHQRPLNSEIFYCSMDDSQNYKNFKACLMRYRSALEANALLDLLNRYMKMHTIAKDLGISINETFDLNHFQLIALCAAKIESLKVTHVSDILRNHIAKQVHAGITLTANDIRNVARELIRSSIITNSLIVTIQCYPQQGFYPLITIFNHFRSALDRLKIAELDHCIQPIVASAKANNPPKSENFIQRFFYLHKHTQVKIISMILMEANTNDLAQLIASVLTITKRIIESKNLSYANICKALDILITILTQEQNREEQLDLLEAVTSMEKTTNHINQLRNLFSIDNDIRVEYSSFNIL